MRRALVTVLKADISGSTPLGEKLDPEELRGVLGTYFGALAREIQRHGGLVDKYIGDAVMAVFGLPDPQPDDAARCEAITPHLRRWMEQPEPLPLRYREPCDGRACGHLLYTDPEGEFFVISVVFPQGTSSGVHYHGAWGVIGILAGVDEETKYSRDESPEHIAIGQGCELRQVDKIYSPAGTITYLRPRSG